MNFQDLEFGPHPGCPGSRAVVQFSNGYGASVITGSLFYSRPGQPYEIAVLDSAGNIVYDTPVTDDVLGYLTVFDAEDVLRQIQELPERKEQDETVTKGTSGDGQGRR